MVDKTIENTFHERFKGTFAKPNPSPSEIHDVFDWVEDEGKYARSLEVIETLDKLRLEAEMHFCKFDDLKKKARNESEDASKALKKSDKGLRTTETETEITTKGVRRKEVKQPPKK